MNIRIKELAGQANIHFSRVGILDGDPNGSARMVGYSKMEKFAELIVRECAEVCYDHSRVAGGVDTDFGYGYKDCGDDIKRNFGVEE
jgi:hypothetical protein